MFEKNLIALISFIYYLILKNNIIYFIKFILAGSNKKIFNNIFKSLNKVRNLLINI